MSARMRQQIKKENIHEFQQFQESILQSQCKICYLDFDSSKHHPMLACAAQHIICLSCFKQLSKRQQFLQCPFCKRNTNTDNVVKFKYVLNVAQMYNSLRGKYLQVMDRLNTGKEVSGGFKVKYKQTLMSLESTINDLKARLKQSEDRNKQYSHQIELERQKYTVFQREIIQHKFNEIIIKNKLTMAEYELEMKEKEKIAIYSQLAETKRELFNKIMVIQDLKIHKQELRQEIEKLKKQNQKYSIQMKSEKEQNEPKIFEECPQMDLQELKNLNSDFYHTPKKSKSEQKIKQQLLNKTPPSKPYFKKIGNNKKSQQKSRPKDQSFKVLEKKKHKIIKS